jgi:hypothetical protein
MTNQGYTLNYAAGHPTSALPGNEPIEATWSAARAYGARALVVVGRFGLYPEILHTAGDPPFQPAAQGDGFEIFWIDSALR